MSVVTRKSKLEHLKNGWDFLRWLLSGTSIAKITLVIVVLLLFAFSSFSFSIGNVKYTKDSITTIIINLVK